MGKINSLPFIVYGILFILHYGVHGLPAVPNDDCISECDENVFPANANNTPLVEITDADRIRKIQAHFIEKIIDRNVNPCDDFYNFACGNWGVTNNVGKSSGNYIQLFMKRMHENTIMELLKSNILDDDIESIRKAKNYYAACMDTEKIKRRGYVKPLKEFLRSFGSWPALDENWSPENFDWLNLTAQMNLYGFNTVMEWSIISGLNVTKLVNLREVWNDQMSNVLRLLGVTKTYQDKLYEMASRFDGQLLDILSEDSENAEILEVEWLSESTGINWKNYLSIVTPNKPSYFISVQAYDYFLDLGKLMHRTDPEVFANFAFLHIIDRYVNTVNMNLLRNKKRKHIEKCRSTMFNEFRSVLSAMFVQNYVSDEMRRDLTEMILDVREAAKEALQNTTWLDEKSKKAAITKLEVSRFLIGYIDRVPIKNLDKLYKDVHIDPEKYIENILSLAKNRETIEQWKSRHPSYVVNAFFQRTCRGRMLLSAGYLAPPIYHILFPRLINFASIGRIIGHEFMHGFDVNGIQYDADGNRNVWFDENLQLSYAVRAACFREQYKKYKLPDLDLYVNPDQTISENIADGEGLEFSYRAYKNWAAQNEELADLELNHYSGLNFTVDQLFFIAFAQTRCEERSYKQLQQLVKNDPHTPSLYRLIGSVSNSQSFADAFQCPLGSAMNPTRKCEYLRQ